jgi:hypothetical protein
VSEVLRKRKQFWENCKSKGGNKEVWDALRLAVEFSDLHQARIILESVNVIFPTGKIYSFLGDISLTINKFMRETLSY